MAIVKFGDVATRVNTKEDRHNTDLVYYVGGDHIDSNALKVSKRGVIKGAPLGPMFYFGFKPGDILFVTRNPHLRKSAMVDFSGICSEKTLVIATKDENVLCQKYLAGVMQSDDFWDFLEENKSGSVNYFINWSTLAEYEFDLPPIEEQRVLAAKLWAANDLKEKYQNLLAATDDMLKAKFRELFKQKTALKNDWPIVMFKEICVSGPQNGFYRKGSEINGTVAILKMKQLFANESMDLATDCDRVSMTEEEVLKYRLTENDLVFGRRSLVSAGAGKCRRVGALREDTVFESSMLRVTLDVNKAVPIFVQAWSEWGDGAEVLSKLRSGTTVVGVKGSDLKTMPIILPPIDLQREFVAVANAAEVSKAELKKSIASIDAVMKGLIDG